MPYIDRHLAPGEHVVFRTRFHPVMFAGTLFFALCVVGVAALIVHRNALAPETVRLLWLAAVLTIIISFVSPYLRWRTSEFAVTTRRVLVKVGLVSIHTVELLLPKGEAIGVDQPLAGRLLGYGTLRLVGTGGTVEIFPRVARAEAVREAVVSQFEGGAVARGR
ncbi:MAG TPA: PH domain-containing protein [Candidatus Binatus sp.]|jgi:uncharacterized membrane protein YdbT with pleckstrin-like domain|nr:PH domain-containing protein [Candidatus Binatus sp.]